MPTGRWLLTVTRLQNNALNSYNISEDEAAGGGGLGHFQDFHSLIKCSNAWGRDSVGTINSRAYTIFHSFLSDCLQSKDAYSKTVKIAIKR